MTVSQLEKKLAALSQHRTLHCGAVVEPANVRSASDWDFLALRLSAEGGIVFSDLLFPTAVWQSKVVGLLSEEATAAGFERELSWARHLSLPAVVCPLSAAEQPEVLRALASHLADETAPPVLVRSDWTEAHWRRWHRVRRLAGWNPRMMLCLHASSAPADLERFLAEPVECLYVSGDYDRASVRRLFRNRTERLILENPDAREEAVELFRLAWRGVSERDRFLADREQDLVPPVQPLRDDMSSGTYAHFEQAGPKYQRYFEAIRAAFEAKRPSVVTVAGAGRGPLVQAVLQVARLAEADPKVYAVEKNQNAVVTLEERNRREWGGAVEIVAGDMRGWSPSAPSDLIVSELLGSFGDNELSPECLEGAEQFLAEGGVMIPRRTVSWVAPVFAPRLVTVETPVGITLSRTRLLADPQACFEFEHPSTARTHGFRRCCKLTFIAAIDAVITGFVGFFEAQLFGEIDISIRPATATPNMEGWAPLYFPLARAVDVTAGAEIRTTFFRENDGRRVWYEWTLERPDVLPLHNVAGARDFMSL